MKTSIPNKNDKNKLSILNIHKLIIKYVGHVDTHTTNNITKMILENFKLK